LNTSRGRNDEGAKRPVTDVATDAQTAMFTAGELSGYATTLYNVTPVVLGL